MTRCTRLDVYFLITRKLKAAAENAALRCSEFLYALFASWVFKGLDVRDIRFYIRQSRTSDTVPRSQKHPVLSLRMELCETPCGSLQLKRLFSGLLDASSLQKTLFLALGSFKTLLNQSDIWERDRWSRQQSWDKNSHLFSVCSLFFLL